MDKQHFIERMLETENLTDELEDQDARWLLDWGISQLDDLLKDVHNIKTASNKVTSLMGIMRKINHLVGTRSSTNTEKLGTELTELDALFVQTFGKGHNFELSDVTKMADRLRQISAKNALELLLESQP